MLSKVDSNPQVASNLMLESRLRRREDELKYIPGDYVVKIDPLLRDVRNERDLTPDQLIELHQYLVCLKCGRPCAGTCENSRGEDIGTPLLL